MKLYRHVVSSCLMVMCLLIGTHSTAEEAIAPRKADPITAEMREALSRINQIHNGMEQRVIDNAVDALHSDIARLSPEVFVPMAIPHLMRLAPKETRTRILLRQAMAKHWIDEDLARAWLVLAGDPPQPHINALIQALERLTPQGRAKAIEGLEACGAYGRPALPRLRKMVENAKADPRDFERAYRSTQEMPEHVLAHVAIRVIEADIREHQEK